MGELTPMMPPAALERLLEVARADTHQARYAANFLLAWWNAGDLGDFDLTDPRCFPTRPDGGGR